MKKFTFFIAITSLFWSCEPEFIDPITEPDFYSSGSTDLSVYVAVGNSLTAGYADGALYRQGQENSFPNILASQFALAGGGSFSQPFMSDNLGGMTLNGAQILSNRRVLEIDASGNPTPVILEGTPATELSDILEGPFNNMGVPGAKSYHILANGYGNLGNFPQLANPYFIRMASSPEASILEDAVSQNPTFFSLWLGNNDVLGYATSGGTGVDQQGNLNPATYGPNDITDVNVFAATLTQAVEVLSENDTEGVLLNIPDVTAIPFFTTVPYNAIPLDATTAAFLNQAFAPYNGGLQLAAANGIISSEEAAARTITFSAGQNPVVITDESLTDLTALNPQLTAIRQATQEDFLPLTVSSLLGTLADPGNPQSVIGVSVPLNDAQVLTETEATLVKERISAYNTIIAQTASNYDLAMVDVFSLLNELAAAGIPYDGGTLTGTFGTGGAFSLDGVHLTARGYAVVANAVISAVNAKYEATLPVVNPGTYPAVFVN